MSETSTSIGTGNISWIAAPAPQCPLGSPGPLFDAGVEAAWAVAKRQIADLKAERDAYRRDAERLLVELNEARKALREARR